MVASEASHCHPHGPILVVESPETEGCGQRLRAVLDEATYSLQSVLLPSLMAAEPLLAQIQATDPALVILPVTWPENGAYRLCQQLRAHPPTAELPILLMAGSEAELDRQRLYACGGDDYLLEPLVAAEVHRRLQPLLAIKVAGEAMPSSIPELTWWNCQSDLVCRFRPEGVTTFVNQAYCDCFNTSSAALVGQAPPPHLTHQMGNTPTLTAQMFTPAHAQVIYECPIALANGDRVWQQWSHQALFDAQGQPLEIQAVGRDITRYKHIEAQLQGQIQQSQAFTRIIDRIRRSLDMKTVQAVTTDEMRQVLRCDRVSIYQFAPDWSGHFVAESVAAGWVPLVGDHIRTIWADTYLQEHQGGRYRRQETFTVDDIYTAGHSSCHIDILEQFQVRAYAVVPIFRDDQLWGLLSAYQNSGPRPWHRDEISLLAQASHHLGIALQQADLLQRMQQSAEQADAANRAKSEFLANMSHELRTPLNAILGFAQILQRDLSLSPSQRHYIDTINSSSEYLLQLINTILSMSKIEAGQMSLTPSAFDLAILVQDLMEMLQAKAAAKGLMLRVEWDPQVPQFIRCDQNKLQQVLVNLVGNGIKFTQQGHVTLAVDRVASPPEQNSEQNSEQNNNGPQQYLQFAIEDTGPGIAPEDIPKLFTPFTQTDLGRQANEGTGLGLTISQRFVRMMGGELSLECPLSGGSIFRFTIPVDGVETLEMKPRLPTAQIVGLAADQPDYRILIVEDHPSNRDLMVSILTAVGLTVRTAANGQDAIAQWQAWRPHLIWMDLRMPVLDGYEATRQIKAEAAAAETPVILALTASVFDEEEHLALEAGCDGFVRKPVRAEDLFSAMAEHLGLRYDYAQPQDVASQRSESSQVEDAATWLLDLPRAWIDQLYAAASAVDNQRLQQLLDTVAPDHPQLTQLLHRWMDDFRCDRIVSLVEAFYDDYS